MTTIRLRLRATKKPDTIDLARLTPRARALAEVLAAAPSRGRTAVLLESARTVREMDPEADPWWWSTEKLDAPHRVVWEHWSRYPARSTLDPHDYLEQQARKLPIGYYPVGPDFRERPPSADAARAEAHLIGRERVLEVLRECGRPISAATLDNYRSRPPQDWPQPCQYVGRTPLWSEPDVRAYGTGLDVEACQ